MKTSVAERNNKSKLNKMKETKKKEQEKTIVNVCILSEKLHNVDFPIWFSYTLHITQRFSIKIFRFVVHSSEAGRTFYYYA